MRRIADENRYTEPARERAGPAYVIGMFVAYEYRVEFRSFDSDNRKPVEYFPGGESDIYETLRFSCLDIK